MAEWRTIETAPAGRAYQLIWCAGAELPAIAQRAPGGDWVNVSGELFYEGPTHWMPLPEPPTTGA